MELKPYQQSVINDLKSYLEKLKSTANSRLAFREFWKERVTLSDSFLETGIEYKNNIPNVAHVCIKVPTAGGKTFIACNALEPIFESIPTQTKAVIWLVPSVTILEQTIKNLSNSTHPYRQKINTHFSGRVEVYTKDKLLQGANFNPTSVMGNLSIIVLSFDTLRVKKKEDRKIYQENGQLGSFASFAPDSVQPMPDTDETALINVIRKLHPVVIVDESHNAETELSIEMLRDINPSFILDLTATPRKNSNIISIAHAGELKKESMVKLPVIVSNHKDKTEVILSAIQLQKNLESIAIAEEKETGKYIRPIVLFQAQPKSNEDSTTFELIKRNLIEMHIPENQIKIKTANINEIKGIDLLARDCPVRFIITINALKEGWDCPFAYILASLAGKSSSVDVEQILGRVLRQPYTMNHTKELLNLSYVMTASNKFLETLGKIVEGMNKCGFGSKDYRVAEIDKSEEKTKTIQPMLSSQDDSLEEIDVSRKSENAITTVENLTKQAIEQSNQYKEIISSQSSEDAMLSIPEELKGKVNMIYCKEIYKDRIIDFSLPQFVQKVEGGLGIFGDEEYVLFENDTLLTEFKLSRCDIEINFDETDSEIYQIDVKEDKKDTFSVEYEKVDKVKKQKLEELILAAPKESQVREMTANMMKNIGNLRPIKDMELEKYLNHIFQDFTPDKIRDCFNREYIYTAKIKQKIERLKNKYVQEQFKQYLATNKITVQDNYKIPITQIAGDLFDSPITKSLYPKEHKMNDFEKRVINEIANLENVLFWTKNLERKGFRLNGFINHYPDFIVVTKKGNILIVESKGDDRDNSDSAMKVELGKQWESKAGSRYKYFMIFDKTELKDAYPLDKGLKLISDL